MSDFFFGKHFENLISKKTGRIIFRTDIESHSGLSRQCDFDDFRSCKNRCAALLGWGLGGWGGGVGLDEREGLGRPRTAHGIASNIAHSGIASNQHIVNEWEGVGRQRLVELCVMRLTTRRVPVHPSKSTIQAQHNPSTLPIPTPRPPSTAHPNSIRPTAHHAHKHTHTHTRTHTYMRTHTHTHAHTIKPTTKNRNAIKHI